MMSKQGIKLTDVLTDPQRLEGHPPLVVSDIISEAKFHNMLAQLNQLCEQSEVWEKLPLQARQHIESACYSFEHQQSQLVCETNNFAELFDPLGISWVYLKGAAYHIARFKEFHGRLMGDIDILVAEDELAKVESLLLSHHWLPTSVSNYDEMFYRELSQEIPPMRHLHRQTELDIHFNILPKTLKESPNIDALMNSTLPLSEGSGAKVLTPAAMVVHSAIHLFYESEFHKGLRDLHDIYLLFSRYAEDASFWQELIRIEQELSNGSSMFLAIRYCRMIFGLKVPEAVFSHFEQYRPSPVKLAVLDFSFKRCFAHSYPKHRLSGHRLAENILYYRGHLKRMPLRLLIPHFFRKLVSNFSAKDEDVLF